MHTTPQQQSALRRPDLSNVIGGRRRQRRVPAAAGHSTHDRSHTPLRFCEQVTIDGAEPAGYGYAAMGIANTGCTTPHPHPTGHLNVLPLRLPTGLGILTRTRRGAL